MSQPLVPMTVGLSRVRIRKNIIEYDQKEVENASSTGKRATAHSNYISFMCNTHRVLNRCSVLEQTCKITSGM